MEYILTQYYYKVLKNFLFAVAILEIMVMIVAIAILKQPIRDVYFYAWMAIIFFSAIVFPIIKVVPFIKDMILLRNKQYKHINGKIIEKRKEEGGSRRYTFKYTVFIVKNMETGEILELSLSKKNYSEGASGEFYYLPNTKLGVLDYVEKPKKDYY